MAVATTATSEVSADMTMPMPPRSSLPRVLVVAGPTGTGKSSMALRLASSLGGSIISCDSVQVYRHMDIGANKVDRITRERIPHFAIDIADVKETVTAGAYHRIAAAAIAQTVAAKRIPIVCGGSMMYLRWLLYDDIPNTNVSHNVRAQAAALVSASDGDVARLCSALGNVSADARAFIIDVAQTRTHRHLTRAVEIVLATGKPPPFTNVAQPTPLRSLKSAPLSFDARCVHLCLERTWLNRQIDYRCETMIRDGLLAEVIALIYEHHIDKSEHATAIGYRHAIHFLRAGDWSLTAFRNFLADFQTATRQYVRRQLVWFRNDPLYRFIRVPTPPVPIDAKDVPHPDSLQISEQAWADVDAQVSMLFAQSADDYWSDHCDNTAVVEQQTTLRDDSRHQPNDKARRRYQTRLFIYANDNAAQEIIEQTKQQMHSRNERHTTETLS